MSDSLEAKLAEVYVAVQRVPKRGKHPQGWAFATESDIADVARRELGQRGIVIIPSLIAHEEVGMGQTKGGAPITRHTVDVGFLITDGERTLDPVRWRGQADDSSDKGLNKALTAARKYFLIGLLQLSTGEDPDGEEAPAPEVHEPRPGDEVKRRWGVLRKYGIPDEEMADLLKAEGIASSAELADDATWARADDILQAAKKARTAATTP